jgi:hypothetical protein
MVKDFKRNLREKPLEQIYHEDFPDILSTRRDADCRCNDCAHRATCSNCPGVALWETCSSDSHVDFACRLSDVRAKRYGATAGGTRANMAHGLMGIVSRKGADEVADAEGTTPRSSRRSEVCREW